ncbi:TRAP transporter substrate-binding protein [Ensifer aridi]|uniref:TRAP transporter substrate-binding protein n=1 Tax=Ensifer aridi TaxID=1708715 RepID=UPI0003FBE79E|nr:TRAP transporter substrate-binding protein [Ensifer aridi]
MKTTLKTIVLAAGLGLAALTAQAADFNLKVAHNGNEEHPFQDGFATFKRLLEEGSGGRIQVTIYAQEQLGPEDKVNNMVRDGLVAANATSTGAGLSPYVPDIDALNYPFLFKSMEHFYEVMDGPVGQKLAKEVEEKLNVVVLGWGFSGTRSLWNSKHPVVEPSDVGGLKIRTMNSPALINSFAAVGAQVTPLAFGEVYNALQQGVIDGAETDNVDLVVERFYEATKYVSMTNHLYLGAAYVFSRKVYDKLPEDLQQLVIEAGKEAVAAERAAMDQKTVEARSFLESKGLVFNEVNHEAFEAAVKSVYDNAQPDTVRGLLGEIRSQ